MARSRKKKKNTKLPAERKSRQPVAAASAEPTPEEEAVRIYRPGPTIAPAPTPEPAQPESAKSASVPSLEDAPLPFAAFVQEILEEYRSDSSPTRYAMSVELNETEDEDDAILGPPDPFLSGTPDLFHAFLNDAEDRDLPPDPAEMPQKEAASSYDWLDIVNEFRTEQPTGRAPAARNPAGTGRTSMTAMDRTPAEPTLSELQPDSFAALPEPEDLTLPAAEEEAPAAEEDALPSGIHLLTERRSEAEAPQPSGHLSVEDILSEFGTQPTQAQDEPAPERPEPRHNGHGGRRSRLEAEARSLFSAKKSESAKTPAAPPKAATAAAKPAAPEPELLLNFSEDPAPELSTAQLFSEDAPEAVPMEERAAAPEPEKPTPAEAGASEKPKSGKKRKAIRLPRRKKAGAKAAAVETDEAAFTQALRDEQADAALYAADEEYEPEPEPDANAFPSFGEYLVGLVTGFWVRLRGVAPAGGTETMEVEDEELGEELSPASASKYYGSFVHSLRLRFRIALGLWIVLLYLSLGFPATGMLKSIDVASGMCLGLQLGIMLLSLDVVTGAAINLARGRFGADSLAVLSCVLTSLDALAVLLKGFGTPHVPLCLLSSFSLLGVLYASYLSARGLRKSLRVPAIGKHAYSVTAEDEFTDRSVTLIKSTRPVTGFVRRSEEAAPDETAYNRAAPLLLILAVIMSLVIVLVKKSASNYLYVLTAVLAPAVPVTALLSYAMPFFIGSQRIFTSGAAIAGWSGLCDVGNSHNLIVTDRDLFPSNCVQIETIRIFADIPSEKIISYAGTMICASGSGLSGCFTELMERNGCALRQVERFETLSGGGFQGTIDGQTILCGGTELMRLMNVRIPYRLVTKTSVLLAIDGVLYGIFNIKYEPNPTVKRALVGLMRSNRHPIFAIRDFNVNPEMLHETFDVATDGYDFPPYVERFVISEAKPSESRKIAAVLCREGLGPLVHMADSGRNMYLAVRLNLMISLLASAFGVCAVFFLLITKGTVALSALLFYALVWIIPVTLISLFLRF